MTQLRFLEKTTKTQTISTPTILGLFALGTFGLHLLTMVALLLLYSSYSRLSRKPPPTLVQAADGSVMKVSPLASSERTPEVIQRFTGETMSLLMNWSGKLPPKTVEEANDPQLDPGVPIKTAKGDRKVSSAAYQASFALSEDFRKEFIKKIVDLTPQEVFAGQAQVLLVTREVGVPEKIADGRWKVKLIANLVTFRSGDNVGVPIAFNKEVFLQAVDSPEPAKESTDLAKAVYQIRQAGLEIYAIRDYERDNL